MQLLSKCKTQATNDKRKNTCWNSWPEKFGKKKNANSYCDIQWDKKGYYLNYIGAWVFT